MLLKVEAVRYVDDHFPGWIECEFLDAENRCHHIVEKVPVLTEEDFGPDSSYPGSIEIYCDILEKWKDGDGRDLLRVSTLVPDGIETTEGLSEFVVLPSQMVPAEVAIVELEKKAADCEKLAKLEPKKAELHLRRVGWYRYRIAALRTGHWPQL